MTQVYVIQTGQTTWQEQSRLEGAAGAPLTVQGAMDVQDAARELAGHAIKAAYACTASEAERQTAELVAKALRVKVCDNGALHELDYGLWQGLTVDEIKRRQGKAYRRWTKEPASVRPPEGETLAEAQGRLGGALKDITKRHKDGSALLVLRPILVGLLKCLAGGEPLDGIWQNVDGAFRWGCYEVQRERL